MATGNALYTMCLMIPWYKRKMLDYVQRLQLRGWRLCKVFMAVLKSFHFIVIPKCCIFFVLGVQVQCMYFSQQYVFDYFI